MIKHLVCLLEEPSAKALLEPLLPRLLPIGDIKIYYQVYHGKQDLERNLEMRIRRWVKPDTVFLVMRDQDSGDCKMIKEHLSSLVQKTGKSKSCLIRIACHELESFYLGDLSAVAKAFALPRVANMQKKRKFKDPDELANACDEFKKLLPKLESKSKVRWARKMSPYLGAEESNLSGSYRALISGLRRLLSC